MGSIARAAWSISWPAAVSVYWPRMRSNGGVRIRVSIWSSRRSNVACDMASGMVALATLPWRAIAWTIRKSDHASDGRGLRMELIFGSLEIRVGDLR